MPKWKEKEWLKTEQQEAGRGSAPGEGRRRSPIRSRSADRRNAEVIFLPEPPEMEGTDVPPVKEYMKASQKSGIELCAEDVFKSTYLWLKERGCERFVNTQLIEQYAMTVSRWVQCETCISEYGFLAKHPTTGAAITSPYVTMSQNYLKQVNQCWYQIVKENCSVEYGGANPHDDLMERLLSTQRR